MIVSNIVDQLESDAEPAGSSRRVYAGIIDDLEARRLVPGQRLIETDLARRFEVGRNAVREAVQHLAARGVVDLAQNRSPTIRQLTREQSLDVLEVAEAMTRLAVRRAADGFDPERHQGPWREACERLVTAARQDEGGAFNRARRHFYRLLLAIGGNSELQRLFPAIGMHIIHAQYASERLREIRLADYHLIAQAVAAKDCEAASSAATNHIVNVRALIQEVDGAR